MEITIEDAPEYESLLNRAIDAGLKASLQNVELIDEEENITVLNIPIQSGRNFVHLTVDTDNMEELSAIQFENVKFVDQYYAVYCSDENWIEVSIESNSRVSSFLSFRRLHRAIGTDLAEFRSRQEIENLGPITVTDETKELSLQIGRPSDIFRTMLDLSDLNARRFQRGLSLRIEGLEIGRHDDATKAIERLASSFLFQIELLSEVGYYIQPRQEARRARAVRETKRDIELTVPKVEYDPEPLSLYWYSQVAINMPLLQFLVLYQSIEYFFPVYSAREAQRVLARRLKDPTFNFDKDTDVVKLLADLRTSSKGGYGSEREQLAAVVGNCVQSHELKSFFQESKDRIDFYKDKDKFGRISQIKIPRNGSNADLTRLVADRLYDVRCRIVHAKSDQDESSSAILPFSIEAQSLTNDIDLARLVARKTLVASGTSLRL